MTEEVTPWVLVVEDSAGEAILRRLLQELASSWTVELVENCGGVDQMRLRMNKYRNASHVVPHFLLADLDRHTCAPALLNEWRARSLPKRLLLRVAVREVEAWLLADRNGVTDWLKVSKSHVPANPELEIDPKATLISLARRSRSRRFSAEFCPAPGSAASQGPLYNAHIKAFVSNHWNVDAARTLSPSLDRACQRIVDWAR